jgi:hypothetical protein
VIILSRVSVSQEFIEELSPTQILRLYQVAGQVMAARGVLSHQDIKEMLFKEQIIIGD